MPFFFDSLQEIDLWRGSHQAQAGSSSRPPDTARPIARAPTLSALSWTSAMKAQPVSIVLRRWNLIKAAAGHSVFIFKLKLKGKTRMFRQKHGSQWQSAYFWWVLGVFPKPRSKCQYYNFPSRDWLHSLVLVLQWQTIDSPLPVKVSSLCKVIVHKDQLFIVSCEDDCLSLFSSDDLVYWKSAPLPAIDTCYGLASNGTSMYIYGKTKGSRRSRIFRSMSDRSDNLPTEWQELANSWCDQHRAVFLLLNDRLVLIGGYGRSREPLFSISEFDLRQGVWIEPSGVCIPLHVTSQPAVVADGRLYLRGSFKKGKDASHKTVSIDVSGRDPLQNAVWKTGSLPSLPHSASGLGSAKNHIVVAGGMTTKLYRHSSDVFVFNRRTSRWQKITPLSVPRVGAVLIEFTGKLLAIGGHHCAGYREPFYMGIVEAIDTSI